MLLLAWLLGCGCDGSDDLGTRTPPGTTEVVPFEPAAATMYRVTDAEWRNSVEDLLGVTYDGALPVDYVLHGYTRIGASELTIPPLDLELYEAAAWDVATEAVPDPTARDALLGCSGLDSACVRGWAAGFARRAWRRPADADELDDLHDLHEQLLADTSPEVALQGIVAAILLSPAFVFRVELGEPDPDNPGWRRYTSLEMAGRLASFLTASVPDDELLDAGLAGDLLDAANLEAQALRLLETPRARDALTAFFSETLELQDLDAVTKDAALFPTWDEGLRAEMVLELELLFQDLVLDNDADLGELLTTSTSFVGADLGEVYGVSAGPGIDEVSLPAADERGGLLGRAGILALQAHHVATSPTLRGRFVQTRLLCRSIPPPPPGVDTSLDDLSAEGTLRDQLEQHMTDPVCASCHQQMDPIGFALEHFDAIGARREQDNGLPIDATGEIDDVPFDGAAELGQVVAAHPEYAGCWALQLYRSANGQAERLPELVEVDAITAAYEPDGRRLRELVVALVTSRAFRLATSPLGETCGTEGETRACDTACGGGTEVCADGRWRACTATAPSPETCDGADQDCDQLVDERLERACDATFGPGTQVCADGQWLGCEGPGTPPEVWCNGVDDDQDGSTDEGQEVAVAAFSYTDVVAAHYACDPIGDPYGPACHAAAHRACAATGCAVTGWGPLDLRATDTDLACLDASEGVVQGTTFTELATYHWPCDGVTRQGPDCNAAISRLCSARGLGTGFGPVENYNDDATIVCTPNATVLNGSYAVLATYGGGGCNASPERAGASCNRAIDAWCRDQGFETGHGPLENSGDLAVVACMGVP